MTKDFCDRCGAECTEVPTRIFYKKIIKDKVVDEYDLMQDFCVSCKSEIYFFAMAKIQKDIMK